MKKFLICAVLLSITPPVLAQHSVDRRINSWDYRVEVFGSVGWGKFQHGDNSLGNGMDLGGGIGFRPFTGKLRGLGFEMQVSRLHHDIQYSSTHSTRGNALGISGNVLYHFTRSRFQPYVSLGVGALQGNYLRKGYSEWYSGNPDDPENWIHHENYWEEATKATKMAIKIGAGFKAAITPRIALRPELYFLDTTIGTGYNWSAFKVSIACSYHW